MGKPPPTPALTLHSTPLLDFHLDAAFIDNLNVKTAVGALYRGVQVGGCQHCKVRQRIEKLRFSEGLLHIEDAVG